MKRILSVLVIALSVSAGAAPAPHAAKTLSVTAGPTWNMASQPRIPRLRSNVAVETSSSVFIFPVVGSLAGGNNTFYRSETTLINNRNIQQSVEMFYFQQGIDNCTRPSQIVTLPANAWVPYDDILQNVFNESGIGSLIVQAVDSSGNYDPNGNIDGTSRIWTPSPFSGGTLSQTFPAASFDQANGVYPLSAYGLRSGSGFHTNMGVLNYENAPRTFTVTINGENGRDSFDFNINPCSFESMTVPRNNYGILQLQVQAHDQDGRWYGYGSSVDETTANNWSSVLR